MGQTRWAGMGTALKSPALTRHDTKGIVPRTGPARWSDRAWAAPSARWPDTSPTRILGQLDVARQPTSSPHIFINPSLILPIPNTHSTKHPPPPPFSIFSLPSLMYASTPCLPMPPWLHQPPPPLPPLLAIELAQGAARNRRWPAGYVPLAAALASTTLAPLLTRLQHRRGDPAAAWLRKKAGVCFRLPAAHVACGHGHLLRRSLAACTSTARPGSAPHVCGFFMRI
jgi:hypothetical protein